MNAASPPQTGYDPARLIREHQTGVWRYLRSLGCDTNLADDLTQEAFLSLLRQPFQERSSAATASYLRKTAYHLLVSFHRRSGRVLPTENIEELDKAWTRWAGADDGDAMLTALHECFDGLSDRARLALELRFKERESRQNIAARLEITEHGVKNLMQRAKQQLRNCIEVKMK